MKTTGHNTFTAMILTAAIAVLLTLSGCTDSSGYKEPEFPSERQLRFEILGEPLTTRDFGDIFTYGDYIIVCGHDSVSGNTFHVFDKASGLKVMESIQFGGDPGRTYMGYTMATLHDGVMSYIDPLDKKETVFNMDGMLSHDIPTVTQFPILLPESNIRTWDLGDRYLFHNNTYTYYGRDKTHPNLGYEYHGIGNGLELKSNLWPCSDLEMMEATVDGYIQDYVKNGTPFHTYYMTVSGHCNYTWSGNAMSRKNQAVIQEKYPNASEQVQAYLACNLELEYAMDYLVKALEEAGIADDTVIALTADHYPYALAEGGTDYYKELSGVDDTERDTSRYRNTFILWSGCMEEPVVVDTPCSAIDIVPTLSNLFGLEYDSRLYSGRDIFATNYQANQYSSNMPLVVFANKGYGNSWITAAGTYEASTGTFTPREGVTVDDKYVGRVKSLVGAKYAYAKLVIERDYYSLVWPK